MSVVYRAPPRAAGLIWIGQRIRNPQQPGRQCWFNPSKLKQRVMAFAVAMSGPPFPARLTSISCAKPVTRCFAQLPMSRRTDPPLPPLWGLVLLGGLSLRMGADKAQQSYHGEPQGLWAYKALQSVCPQVFLSARPGQDYYWLAQCPVIRDRYHNLGPAAGLLSAADAHPQAAWLLLACDMPLVDEATLSAVVRARGGVATAIAFRHPSGAAEPLCAIYEPPACQHLRARVEEGQGSSLRALLEVGATRWLQPPDPGRLLNANDPARRAELTARLKDTRRQ